ncbi:mucin TcMUCII [Trypanosoma cruzi cruzi]|nr:mucin TcMUCII [Trypanosoma cruzi cruzi]
MTMTCRLLCALLVLALCCCPSVCVAATQEAAATPQTTITNTTQPGVNNIGTNIKAVGKDVVQLPSPPHPSQGTGQPGSSSLETVAKPGNGGGDGSVPTSTEGLGTNEVSNALKADGNKGTTGLPSDKRLSDEQQNTNDHNTKTTIRPPPLQHRHQALRLQRRQLCRPPTHRHVFAKSTAASAALRGCVPRWCLPHPRWRTPLWAEEVSAGCACQHSTAGIFARVLLSVY